MTISTVSDFLACLDENEGASPAECLYRGQADSEWKVNCSAVRRLEAHAGQRIVPQVIGHALVGYLAILLNEGSQYIGTCPELPIGCSELDLLVQLQHQGAATGLIDFTLNPLVALWFACAGHPEKDGAVYVLSRSNTQVVDEIEAQERGLLNYFYQAGARELSERPYLLLPKTAHGRPASQQSVFILGVPFIWPAAVKKAVIDRNAKEHLLVELRTVHSLTEDSLFADFSGYAQANSVSKSFDITRTVQFWSERDYGTTEQTEKARAYTDHGMAYSAIGHHECAIDQYTEAINIDPNNVGAYVNRAVERRSLGDLAGALTDCSAAIHILTERGEEINKQQIAKLYWNRGQVHFMIGCKDQGWADRARAIDLGLAIYYNEKGEQGPRLEIYPEQLDEYQLLTGDGEGHTD